jgi:hypothetical protein
MPPGEEVGDNPATIAVVIRPLMRKVIEIGQHLMLSERDESPTTAAARGRFHSKSNHLQLKKLIPEPKAAASALLCLKKRARRE